VKGALRVGTCGFPVARDRFFSELDAVEITSTASRLPKIETAERWKSEAPPGFTFAVRAPREIGGGDSPFRMTPALRKTVRDFGAVLAVLSPAFVVYDTSPVFYPSADHMRAMYGYFKGSGRGPWRIVWMPRGRQFETKLLTKIASDLKLMIGFDALRAEEAPRETRYWRLGGRWEGRRVSRGVSFPDTELRDAVSRCASGRESFLFLENAAMWRDARRLKHYTVTGRF